MSTSYTTSGTETFSLTHAKYIASKVAADLLRFQRFYGSPSTSSIDDYEAELAVLLNHDAVDSVVYGFKRNGLWTMASVRYVALPGGTIQADDDPGKIRPNYDVTGASFTSFLTYSSNWNSLTTEQRDRIKRELPFQRTTDNTPGLEIGYWADDRNYVAGGRGLGRSTVRN